MIKQLIEADLKTAMLGGDKEIATILRTVKSAILDIEISTGKRDSGLDEQQIVNILIKESKKRQDSAKIYNEAGDMVRAEKELYEVSVISKYLPEMMSEEQIRQIASEVLASMEVIDMGSMGKVIGAVKSKAGSLADGSMIAKVVKELIALK